jgi:ABC-type uncharacterized transport system substrate-binding protein
MQRFVPALALILFTLASTAAPAQPKCLFVSSYHQGYAWSDGVQRGVEQVLNGKCELRQFDMDGKRRKSRADIQAAAARARDLIESWHPDVVITADDNAARYLVKPFYKDAATPIVFCGVNWSVDEYGFPFDNVTGIIEVAPIMPMLKKAIDLTDDGKSFFYLGADTNTEKKNLARFVTAAERLGLQIEWALVGSTSDWLTAYRHAQKHPFIAIGSHSGIDDWDFAHVQAAVARSGRALTITNHGWMMPVTMIGFTKVPEEHGAWAAEAALAILDGIPPREIPIVSNRKWDLWINAGLTRAASIELPATLVAKAKQ